MQRQGPLLAATADIHAPKNLDLFREALVAFLDELGQPDIMLFVGDIVEKNDYSQVGAVLDVLDEQGVSCPIVACFGNEEYEESKAEYLAYERIRWLDDEVVVLEISGLSVGILGSRGSLDRPTWWQRTHVRGIWATYRRRVRLVDSLLAKLRADVVVVMTHYAPTYRTLEGERERIWPELGCKAFEGVMERRGPSLWLHGHAHRARVLETSIGDTLVVNVSLPARKALYARELQKAPKKPRGLEAFF